MATKDSLGKGLKAILPDLAEDLRERPSFMMCGIEELYPNRFQPRQDFNNVTQSKLISSIKKTGIIQPIVVRKTEKGYEIIAGERRWRAAQAAGLKDVPVIVKEVEDLAVAEMSLIENIQREELNPIEEARAYQTLTEQFGLSHEEIALRVGKDRSTITNTLRLLKLPEEVKRALINREISSGHARALLMVESPREQLRLLREIIKKDLSVRDTERLIRKPQVTEPRRKDNIFEDIKRQIEARLMTKVKISQGKKGGKIELYFKSEDELNRLLDWLMKEK